MSLIDQFIYSENRGIRIFRHVLFWVTDIISYLVVISSHQTLTSGIVTSLLLRVPLVAALVYFIMYYLIPKYSKGGSRMGLTLWILFILIYVGIGIQYVQYFVLNPLLNPHKATPGNVFSLSMILEEIFSWMAVICMAIVIKLIKTKNKLQQKNEELVAEKKNAELSFLKAQMHPHFLFNTLNTLYSEAIKTNSRSEQIVLHLSNLMRFILEECNKPLIPLETELKVICDYIELEKLRHGARLQIDFQSNVTRPLAMVSPLLLLPFIENSFKHTLLTQRGTIPIVIRVGSEGQDVTLRVENDLVEQNGPSHPGMGIRNVRKQLELLYSENFKLNISANGKFVVSLKFPLKNE